MTLEVSGRGQTLAGLDLYGQAEGIFKGGCIFSGEGWSVIAAKLRIIFEPGKQGARAKSVTFELKSPDRTNLRDQTELHRRIADVLLGRWGIYAPEQ